LKAQIILAEYQNAPQVNLARHVFLAFANGDLGNTPFRHDPIFFPSRTKHGGLETAAPRPLLVICAIRVIRGVPRFFSPFLKIFENFDLQIPEKHGEMNRNTNPKQQNENQTTIMKTPRWSRG
jgi:hypothetical protein